MVLSPDSQFFQFFGNPMGRPQAQQPAAPAETPAPAAGADITTGATQP